MAENMQENEQDEQKSSDNYVVPGRVSLEELHKQSSELKAAREQAKKDPKGSQRMFNAVSMYSVAIDFALIIAIPLIALIYAGRWMDQRFGTKYWVLVGILLAIGISSVGIYKQITKLSNLIKKK